MAEPVVYEGLGTLPHFDDSPNVSQEVTALRTAIARADGVLICTPEYAFGVPGSLKNAIDWTVSSGELVEKPLALITAASQGESCHAALQKIFRAISAKTNENTTLLIQFIRSKIDSDGYIKDQNTIDSIQVLCNHFVSAIIEHVQAKAEVE